MRGAHQLAATVVVLLVIASSSWTAVDGESTVRVWIREVAKKERREWFGNMSFVGSDVSRLYFIVECAFWCCSC